MVPVIDKKTKSLIDDLEDLSSESFKRFEPGTHLESWGESQRGNPEGRKSSILPNPSANPAG